MNTDNIKTQRYFHSKAEQFDAFYTGSGFLTRFFDRIFRAGIFDRYRLVFENCGSIENKRILDVGCGSGRYAIEFAQRGATEVTGIDFAENMLVLAEKAAKSSDVFDCCHFINADFLESDFEENSFHITIATGVFDYISTPEDFLLKMVNVTSEKVLASFPSPSLTRMPIRKLRYKLKRCPVYFLSREQLVECLRKIGCSDYEIIKYKSSGYLLVINLN